MPLAIRSGLQQTESCQQVKMVESNKERRRTNRNVKAMIDDSACWEPTHAQTHVEDMRAVYLGVRRFVASADDGAVLHQ